MAQVGAIRLEECDGVSYEVVEPARVVEELADRDALGERRSVSIQVEQAFLDEPEDERRDEDLRHAPDPESVAGGQRLAGSDVCDACGSLDPAAGAVGHDDRAGNTGFDSRFEEMLDFRHEVA
jgi:hypothetical protein